VVEDDGPGIGPEAAVHVFERFYRGDGAGRASGSGLGLAIARELAEAMQGEIALTSEPGRNVFTLSLPASSPPAE
jgi:two-component system OmpR family sensor kinase